MRRLVVALFVALLALSLAGCGGSTSTTTSESPPVATQPAAPEPVEPTYLNDRSANDSDVLPIAFPSFNTTDTPAVIQEKLDAGRPMLIFFYDDRQQVTGTLRAEVDAVLAEYRGLIDVVLFSVNGTANDPGVVTAVACAGELGCTTTPYLLVVDKSGFITWRSKGFAERGVIEREVERATR